MGYNLIDERWIPVERESGRLDLIAPAGIVEREDPPLRIASPRPDFDGALLEFLIGLLQTAAAPDSERAWEREFEEPPAVATLKKRLDRVREAFVLDGDGPRFMQDLTVASDPSVKTDPIGALLVDRIGESGLSEGPSLFAKPGLADELDLGTAAAALMTLQAYAPAGGRGQLTSLRGGGPLTTVVLGPRLWQTVWLNVLPRREFEQRVPGDASNEGPGAVFPWMAPTRTSATGRGVATPPQAVHPLQHFWGLPRRFRLVVDPGAMGACHITGRSDVAVVRQYQSRPDGTSYDGDYRHPLTPYSQGRPGEPWNPKKGSSDGLPYRDWPLLVTGTEQRRPATVVSYFATTARRELVSAPRLAAFGYAMDKMKPLRWCRAETPLVTVAPGLAEKFAAEVDALVAASEEVRKVLSAQVRAAWSDRPADLDVFARINPAFWSATERAFFEAVHGLKHALEADDARSRDRAREEWLTSLHLAAVELFDSFVDAPADLAAPDLRRSVLARRDLVRLTGSSAPKLRKLLGLPIAERAAPGPDSESGTAMKTSHASRTARMRKETAR